MALLRILAVSLISTMKVDWPRARSSLAPMRVKIRSTRSIRALLGGHKRSGVRQQGEQSDLPNIGAFARHVRPGDQSDLLVAQIQLRVVGNKPFFVDALIQHRMAPLANMQDCLLSPISGRQ